MFGRLRRECARGEERERVRRRRFSRIASRDERARGSVPTHQIRRRRRADAGRGGGPRQTRGRGPSPRNVAPRPAERAQVRADGRRRRRASKLSNRRRATTVRVRALLALALALLVFSVSGFLGESSSEAAGGAGIEAAKRLDVRSKIPRAAGPRAELAPIRERGARERRVRFQFPFRFRGGRIRLAARRTRRRKRAPRRLDGEKVRSATGDARASRRVRRRAKLTRQRATGRNG